MSSTSLTSQLAPVARGRGTSTLRPARRWPHLRRSLFPLVLVLAWQGASVAGLLSPRVLASPAQILLTGWSLLASGELPWHLLASLGRVAAGLAIGLILGAGLARLGEDVTARR